jgi:hypothetical protein
MNIALVKNGIVENIAVCDSMEDAAAIYTEYELYDVTDTECGIGWKSNGDGTFSKKEGEGVEATAEELIDIMLGIGGGTNG